MGIDGLLPLLRPATAKEHISKFRGKRLAVDALPWLYKGCYGYAFELNQNVPVNDFMYYISQMLELLRFYGITPVLVFDGRPLPSKAETHKRRERAKIQNREKGKEELQKGNMAEARKFFSRSIFIDERIVATTMNCLRTKGVEFLVAPYEADSQIGKMVDSGEVEAAISEDSDLLLYCSKVILKMGLNGDCDYIDLGAVQREQFREVAPYLYSWLGFDRTGRIQACVMAGCDYLDNVRNIGLKKAIKLVGELGDVDKIVGRLQSEKSFKDKIPEDYALNLKRTVALFLCAKVFDGRSNSLAYFSAPESLPFAEIVPAVESVVGADYPYTEAVMKGHVQAGNFQPREVKEINFKTLFALDTKRLLLEEVRYKLRRNEPELGQQFTPEQIEQARQLEYSEAEKQRLTAEHQEKDRQ